MSKLVTTADHEDSPTAGLRYPHSGHVSYEYEQTFLSESYIDTREAKQKCIRNQHNDFNKGKIYQLFIIFKIE